MRVVQQNVKELYREIECLNLIKAIVKHTWKDFQGSPYCWYPGAHTERATPVLGLCHGVFTDQFIFNRILGHFFPEK